MKAVIIGRGSSCLRCTEKFVREHDLIAVTNKFVFDGYEQYVGSRADIQFRNGSCAVFSNDEIKKLGLKKIIYTHTNRTYPSYPHYYKGVEIIIPHPHIRTEMDKYGFDPSTGSMALYYILGNYKLSGLSIVGFDLYEVGQRPYYFSLKDTDRKLRYLWRGKYKGDVINAPSGHSTRGTLNFMISMFRKYDQVEFKIITESLLLRKVALPNVQFL